jgi:hypothetical protein
MWSAAATAVLFQLFASVAARDAPQFGTIPVAFSVAARKSDFLHLRVFSCRGGGVEDSDDEYDLSDDSEVEESEEEEDDTLLASTVKATTKAQIKKTASAKATVSSTLAETAKATKQEKKSKMKLPYILRAFCNPFTVFVMTKAYFASLFNLEYGKQVRERKIAGRFFFNAT